MYRFNPLSPSFRGLHTLTKCTTGLTVPVNEGYSRFVSASSLCCQHAFISSHDVCFPSQKRLIRQTLYQHRHYSSGSEQKSNKTVPIVAAIVGAAGLIGAIMYTKYINETRDDDLKAVRERRRKHLLDDDAKAVGPVNLPSEVQYLIIGAGTAAMSATKAIRTNDPTAKVLLITEEGYRPYMRPPLSKELWFSGANADKLTFNDWAGKTKDVFYQPREFFLKPDELNQKENGGAAIAYKKKVIKIDVMEQKAHLQDGSIIKYDKCLIATGGTPKTLPIFKKLSPEGMDKVHLFRNIGDFFDLFHATDKAKSVMVIGGGFLGSELAVALAAKAKTNNMKVMQSFPEEGNMGRVFPKYLSKWTLEKVRKEGVEVFPETFLVDCSYNKSTKQLELVMNTGNKFSVDEVIVAVGLEPNVELASESGLEVDSKFGGFLVNAELEARKNLWVAGDASCFYDIALGRRRVEHHDHAIVSGRLAGENMTGQAKPYWHQSMFWSDLGPDVGYEAIGICDSSLPTFAVFAKGSEEDTPKAIVKATGEGMRSETERESSPKTTGTAEKLHEPVEGEDYGKGVIFYINQDKIVGIVLWNLFGRMPIARQVLKEGKSGQDLAEVARLFDIHNQRKPEETEGGEAQ